MDPEIIEQREEFCERLTLGLVEALEKVPNIQDVVLAEHQPSDTIAITSWEQRYSTILPHEIKDFYLATDGFKLTWNYSYAGNIF
jgi:tubulin polyglutamylase complex subunit 2